MNPRTSETVARFTVRSLGRSVTGRIPVTAARIDTDADGRPAAVSAELDLAGIDTGNRRCDRDLRKPGLLDLDNVTSFGFRSTAVEAGDGNWTVTGELTRGEHTAPVRVRAPRLLIGRRVSLEISGPAR